MPTGGTLDDTSWLDPKVHIYVKSKQPWLEISAGDRTFHEMYDLAEVWPKESLERLAAI